MQLQEAKDLLENMLHQEEQLVHQMNAMAKETGTVPKILLDHLDQQQRHHVHQLMQLVQDLGTWPTQNQMGDRAVMAAWLVAHHGVMMPGIRDTLCNWIQQAADKEEIPKWQYPFYYDRVQQLQAKPQRFGTQMVMHANGYPVPYDLEEPESVDARRATYGLPPLMQAVEALQQYTA